MTTIQIPSAAQTNAMINEKAELAQASQAARKAAERKTLTDGLYNMVKQRVVKMLETGTHIRFEGDQATLTNTFAHTDAEGVDIHLSGRHWDEHPEIHQEVAARLRQDFVTDELGYTSFDIESRRDNALIVRLQWTVEPEASAAEK